MSHAFCAAGDREKSGSDAKASRRSRAERGARERGLYRPTARAAAAPAERARCPGPRLRSPSCDRCTLLLRFLLPSPSTSRAPTTAPIEHVMHRWVVVTFSVALGLVGTVAASATSLYAAHPLVGTWRFDVPDTGCAEIYRFRADGTSIVTSGSEVAESEFKVSATPSSRGFYTWTDTIVKDNGKPDCSGQITGVGRKTTNYIRFDRSGQRFIVCRREDLRACFGPLQRIGGDEV